jgi:ATP-binding cassette subfamily B protein
MSPLSSLVTINLAFQDAKIAADRLFEVMDLDKEESDKKIILTAKDCGDIEFRNVSFRYGSRVDVFENFSVTFPKGKVSAIVGESGSGKTTIASLIQNMYPLHEGSVSIVGVNVRHIDNASLRSLVGVVPQRIDLFGGSVAENITLDDFDADWQRMVDVCKNIGVLEFIEKLPYGFNTNIGENGVQLSGGQRQRLAIARALYRDPQIVIFDEATSALDSESEMHIKGVVQKLRDEGRTIILIAHRLGTVMEADKIVVLENGRLIEEGTHGDLIARQGLYANFWRRQTGV